MTPALLREAADRLDLSLRKFWSIEVRPLRPPFCGGCSTDYPNHKPDCLITRLRTAAGQMEEAESGGHKIIEGLEDALAFAKGDTSRARLTTIIVKPQSREG